MQLDGVVQNFMLWVMIAKKLKNLLVLNQIKRLSPTFETA